MSQSKMPGAMRGLLAALFLIPAAFAQDVGESVSPTLAWKAGETARYQYQQSVREAEAGAEELKYVANGQIAIEVLSNESGTVRLRWQRHIDNVEWEIARMPFPIRGHAGEKLLRNAFLEGIPLVVSFEPATLRTRLENLDEIATRTRQMFDKVGGDGKGRPLTPDELAARVQAPEAGIYRGLRGSRDTRVVSPRGIASWYARTSLAEIEEFLAPFGKRFGCAAPVQADFPVRRPVAGNAMERGTYQCKSVGPGVVLLAADRRRSGIVDYASSTDDAPAADAAKDTETTRAAQTELTNRHEVAIDSGWPKRVANAQTDVSDAGKAQATTVIRRVYLKQ